MQEDIHIYQYNIYAFYSIKKMKRNPHVDAE